MAYVNLQDTLLFYTQEKARINLRITELQNQKSLAIYEQTDCQSLLNARKGEVRSTYAELWNEKEEYWTDECDYTDYTEIPGYEEELEKITATIQEQLDELNAWELQIDNELTTESTRREEIKATENWIKSTMTSNISNDFNFGLGK